MTPSQVTYRIEGMSCDHCETAVSEQVEKVPGVAQVRVDLTRAEVTVHGQFDDSAVRAAVDAAGYEAVA